MRGAGHPYALPRSRLAEIRRPASTPRLDALLLRSVAEALQTAEFRRARETGQAECAALVAALKARAVDERWSHRELTRRAQLSWGTWRRLAGGTADPGAWLPVLRLAASRLGI